MDIEDIYNLIPDFMRTKGCHECCRNFGVPSQTRIENERIKAFLRENGMKPGRAHHLTCPPQFLQTSRLSIRFESETEGSMEMRSPGT